MNVLSLKNGEPERQPAKERRRIREFRLASLGMRPSQSDAHRGAARHTHAADFFLVVTLQGKHSRECPFYQKWRAAVGWLGQPVLEYLPDTVKEGLRPTPSRLMARRPQIQILPRSQKENTLTVDAVRAFSCYNYLLFFKYPICILNILLK